MRVKVGTVWRDCGPVDEAQTTRRGYIGGLLLTSATAPAIRGLALCNPTHANKQRREQERKRAAREAK